GSSVRDRTHGADYATCARRGAGRPATTRWSNASGTITKRAGRSAFVRVVGEPAHQGPQLGSNPLDLLGMQRLAPLEEVGPAVVELLHEFPGERSVADLAENAPHLFDAAAVDDPRATGVAAELRGVRNRQVHLARAAWLQWPRLQLLCGRALEVASPGRSPPPDQGVEAGLDRRGAPAAEHHLLTEQVRLGLLGERGGKRAGPGPA